MGKRGWRRYSSCKGVRGGLNDLSMSSSGEARSFATETTPVNREADESDQNGGYYSHLEQHIVILTPVPTP
jgi:hypothetical protein